MKLNEYYIGDSCLCWSLGASIEPENSMTVLGTYQILKSCGNTDILDIVPSYNSLAVHFNPLNTDIKELKHLVVRAFKKAASQKVAKGKKVKIPIIYNGTDLNKVSNVCGLSKKKIIRLHSEPEYTVAMIGFKPHFPYLSGMNKALEVPRLDSPRKRVAAGSVAIGGSQCGIYPCESPGGWNIIGTTLLKFFITLKPGDKVIFKEVKEL